jgi:uncharacterized protein
MPNRLAAETSPYLQQHADNPVDWHPWDQAALERARTQNKPILLSIGYSACHWCHVMAHESFEDAETAALMNELFVNIKVDREERPDLDQIYQTAHYLLTQRNGGWPLTMFLTGDDQTPFFGGTYFPKHARFNLPGFRDLLQRVADFYRGQRGEIDQQNASFTQALHSTQPEGESTEALSDAPLERAFSELAEIFDSVHGGFGGAPKFPHPAEIEFCLRRYARLQDEQALEMAVTTLEHMARGGLYDQLGGGFARYSVDAQWMIPHFEKMLYDNGPLLRLYADAWLATGNDEFKTVAEESAAWVLREMQSPEGGYYSTLDADSEHQEGKFYVWTPDDVRAVLSAEEYEVLAPHYALDHSPNFEAKHWHLYVAQPLAALAQSLAISEQQARERLASARARLFAKRESRVHPGRDEKILVSWNALMAKGMARAGLVFGQAAWIESAQRAADFIRRTMWTDGRLLATYKDGKAHLNAYLDDYAFLLDALIELMQADFRADDLRFARELGDVLLEQFEDRDRGGFFFVSHDHERLIQRQKLGHDNATPSGNSVAAFALQRLAYLTGEQRYAESAARAIKLFYPRLTRQAAGFSTLLAALEESLDPPQIVILRGSAADTLTWCRVLAARYLPNTLVLALAPGTQNLTEVLDKPVGESVNAWVCRGVTCLPPIGSLQELKQVCKFG